MHSDLNITLVKLVVGYENLGNVSKKGWKVIERKMGRTEKKRVQNSGEN